MTWIFGSKAVGGCVRRPRLVACILATTLGAGVSSQALATGSIDQHQLAITASSAFGGTVFRQDFLATTSALSGIDLYILGYNSPYQDTVSITLRSGDCASQPGAILVSDSKMLTNPDGRVPTHFDLGNLAVTPGAKYTIEVTAPTYALGIQSHGDAYPSGQDCSNSFSDLTFATYDGGPDVPAGCPAEPRACVSATKSTLQIRDNGTPEDNFLQWKYGKQTSAVALSDFGTPAAFSGGYQICVYDTTGVSPAPVVGLLLEGNERGPCDALPCWTSVGDTKLFYKNKSGSFEGVSGFSAKAGDAYKGSAKLKAGGASLPLPGPAAPGERYLDADSWVQIQMYSFDTGKCISSTFEFDEVVVNTGTRFLSKIQ